MQTKNSTTSNSSYNYLEDYITEMRSKGRYVLTLEEVKAKFDLSDKAVNAVFNEYGWFKSPKFVDVETLAFRDTSRYSNHSTITIGRGANHT